jgi:hypothetical protein
MNLPKWKKTKQMKRLALISLLLLSFLAGCADRTRVNCERIKNKAPGVVTTVQVGGGRCG